MSTHGNSADYDRGELVTAEERERWRQGCGVGRESHECCSRVESLLDTLDAVLERLSDLDDERGKAERALAEAWIAAADMVSAERSAHLIASNRAPAAGALFRVEQALRARPIASVVTCGHIDPDGCGCDR